MSDLREHPDLLARFRDNDRAAKSEVYVMHVETVETALRHGVYSSNGARVPGIANEADHADAVQDVFMRAFQDPGRLAYDGVRDYATYLRGIARNVAVDYHRRRRRVIPFPGDASDSADVQVWTVAPQPDAPAHGYLEQKAEAIAREYAANLPEVERSVHDAVFDRYMSREATAKLLGLTEKKVRVLVERFKREVRARLEQAGIRDSNVTPEPEGSSHG